MSQFKNQYADFCIIDDIVNIGYVMYRRKKAMENNLQYKLWIFLC